MEDNVGTIVIGTKVSTKQLQEDLRGIKRTLRNYEKEMEELTETKQTYEVDIASYEKQINELEKIKQKHKEVRTEIEEVKKTQEEMLSKGLSWREISEAGYGGPKISELSEQSSMYNTEQLKFEPYIAEKLEEIKQKYEEINQKIQENVVTQASLKSEIQKTIQEIEKTKMLEDIKNNTGQIENGLGKIEKGFGGLVKKALRLGLALIGIQTLLTVITRAFNTLSQYNEELGTKMEQMRLVLAVALEPIINWLVNMLQVILSLINQIMSSLFGINLFGRASELWTEKMKKNMQKSAGSARDMRKQLAGFDEMNVLNDNVAGSGGGGGGDDQPWELEEKPIPKWMQWILKNGSLIAGIIGGIATALTLLKLGVGGIMALGIGVLVAGIIALILDLIKYLKDPSWENFGNIIRDIGIILIGLGIIIENIPLIVIGAVVLIVGIIIKYWEQIKGFIQGIADWFHQKGEEFKKNGEKYLGGIYQLIGNYVEDVIYIFEWLVGIVKTLFDGIIDFLKKVFAGDWEGAWESIKQTFGKIWDQIKEIASKSWERLKENVKIFVDVVKDLHNKLVLWLAEKTLNLYNKIVGTINGVVNFVINAYNKIIDYFKGIGVAIGDFFSGAVRGAVNGALSFVESRVNDFIRMINNVIGIINEIPGVSIGRIGYVSLPRMAVGGIINQPGRGVPVGGAIAGESGREGILPLTDRQAMAELGREIGKWISIQATVPVNIGNRQVARVIQELNNDREFAMNS